MTLLVQHIGLGGHADEGAQGVEQVHEQEGEDDHDEVKDAHTVKVDVKALTEGVAQGGEVHADDGSGDQAVEPGLGGGDVDAHQLAEDAQDPGDDDAQEDGALHTPDVEDGGDEQTDDGQQSADAVGGEVLGEAGDGHQGGGVHSQTGVLEADEGDEQADAHGDAPLQRQGDGVEDGLTDVGQGQGDEDEALNKDGEQGHLPGDAHAQDHGVG